MTIVSKPWGFEEILHTDNKYTVKRLFMKQRHRCSSQYHSIKQETILVIEGILKLQLQHEDKIMNKGDHYTIKPNEIHRMEGVTDVTYIEASTSELNDIVRLEDDYNRL